MVSSRNTKIAYITFIILAAGTILLPLLTFAASSFPDKTDSNYCKRCHVMEAEYEAWMHSGAHRRKSCVDCHLPNENKTVHYLWKSIDGLKDILVYYAGRIPEKIRISSHGEQVLQSNCIRCHEITVILMDKERKCWSCHRRISHMHTGVRETL